MADVPEIGVKTSIWYCSDDVSGVESLRHRTAADERRQAENARAFAFDIYAAASRAFKDFFQEGMESSWKKGRKRFADSIASSIGDGNENGYLDIAERALYSALSVYFHAPEQSSLIRDGQTEGEYRFNSFLNADAYRPAKRPIDRDALIANLPEQITKDPYHLAKVGLYFDRKYGGKKALSERDMAEIAERFSAYMTAYYVNYGGRLGVSTPITPYSKITDFVVGPYGQAMVNCSVFADVAASIVSIIGNSNGGGSKFSIYTTIVSGAGADEHQITYAQYVNPLTESRTALVFDNDVVRMFPVPRGEDIVAAIERDALSYWSNRYEKGSPVNVAVKPSRYGAGFPISSKMREEGLGGALGGTLRIPREMYGVAINVEVKKGLEEETKRVKTPLGQFEIYLKRTGIGEVFFSAKPPQSVSQIEYFGRYDLSSGEPIMIFPSAYRMPQKEMEHLVLQLGGLTPEGLPGYSEASAVKDVLSDSRDRALVNHVMYYLMLESERVGLIKEAEYYFLNKNISASEMRERLEKIETVPESEYSISGHFIVVHRDVLFELGMEWTEQIGSGKFSKREKLGAVFVAMSVEGMLNGLGRSFDEYSANDKKYSALIERLAKIADATSDARLFAKIMDILPMGLSVSNYSKKIIAENFEKARKGSSALPPLISEILRKKDDELTKDESEALTAFFGFADFLSGHSKIMAEMRDRIAEEKLPLILSGFFGRGGLQESGERLYERGTGFKSFDEFERYYKVFKSSLRRMPPADQRKCAVFFALEFVHKPDFAVLYKEEAAELRKMLAEEDAAGGLLEKTAIFGLELILSNKQVDTNFYMSNLRERLGEIYLSTDKFVGHYIPDISRLAARLNWSREALEWYLDDLLGSFGDFTLRTTGEDTLIELVRFGKISDESVISFIGKIERRLDKMFFSGFLSDVIRAVTHANPKLTEKITSEFVLNVEAMHKNGEKNAGTEEFEAPSEEDPAEGHYESMLIMAGQLCKDQESLSDPRCIRFSHDLAAPFVFYMKTAEEEAPSVNYAGSYNLERAGHVLRAFNEDKGLARGISRSQVDEASKILIRLLNSLLQDERLSAARTAEELYEYATADHRLKLEKLKAAAQKVIDESSMPLRPVVSYEELEEIIRKDPRHWKRMEATTAIKFVTFYNHETLKSLNGASGLPEEILGPARQLIALSKSDTGRSVHEEAGRTEQFIEQGYEYMTGDLLPADGGDGGTRMEARLDTSKIPKIVPVIMDKKMEREAAHRLLEEVSRFNDAYPHAIHTNYFYAMEFVSQDEIGGKAAEAHFEYPDPENQNSPVFVLKVTDKAALEDVIAETAIPALVHARGGLIDKFRRLCSGVSENAVYDEFRSLWREWHKDSVSLWQRALSEYGRGSKAELEKLLIVIQIIADSESLAAVFKDLKQQYSFVLKYESGANPRIILIDDGKRRYKLEYNQAGNVVSTF